MTAEDAIGIAEALEKSLEDVPNRDAMAGKVISLMMPDGKIIKVFQSDTALTFGRIRISWAQPHS